MNPEYYISLVSKRSFINHIIKNHPASIVILSSDGRIKFVNDNFLKLTQYSLDEIYDKLFFDIFTLKEENIEGFFRNIISGGKKNFHFKMNYIKTRSGRKVWMMWTNFIIEDDGKVVGTLSFGYDLTFYNDYVKDIEKISLTLLSISGDYKSTMPVIVNLAREISGADFVVYNKIDLENDKLVSFFSSGGFDFPKIQELTSTYCKKAYDSKDKELLVKNPQGEFFKKYDLNLFYSKIITSFGSSYSLCFFFKDENHYVKKHRIDIISKMILAEENRRTAIEKVLNEKEKLFTVLENIPAGVVYASRSTREIYYVNKKLLQITGLERDEIKDLDTLKYMIVDKKAIEHFAENPHIYGGEITLECLNKNKDKRFIKFTISSLDKNDILMLVEDLTEEVIQKNKVSYFTKMLNIYSLIDSIFIEKRPPELYNHLINFIKDRVQCEYAFLGIVDRENESFKFVAMTEGVKDLCKIGDVFRYKNFLNKNPIWAKTINEGKVFYINEPRYIKGHIDIKNAVSVPVRYKDEIICVMMFANRYKEWDDEIIKWIEDISSYLSQRMYYVLNNEKLTQEFIEFRARDKALTATSNLISGVAHDLNNMLVPVITNISLVKENIKDEYLYSSLYEAEEYLKSASNLIKSFINISNVKMVEFSSISFMDIINTIKMISNGFSLKVDFEISNDIKNLVFVSDKTKLYQVFTNIIKNASESMEDKLDKRIRISVKLVDESFIEFSFRDYGKGIPEELKDEIFKPYFSTKKENRGLGLFISYNIAKILGGELSFQSYPGSGTTFFLKIPFREPELKVRKEDLPQTRKLNFLVVDDEEFVIKSISKILRYLGHNVYSASNSQSAIKIVKEGRIDIAIIDIVLDNEKGQDLSMKIKNIAPSVFCVASTGYTDSDVTANLNDYSFDYSLPKPYSVDTIKEMISSYFSKQK